MDFTIAACSLNQWALDFSGNTRRIIASIRSAHEDGAVYRMGPELELCGYSLEDAFFENDTVYHCWQHLKEILIATENLHIVCDIGMPVHFGCLYNCRVICYMGRILCIRAKTSLAKEGNYRESRHFNAWPPSAGIVPFRLPSMIMSAQQPAYVPFGADFVLDLVMESNGQESTLRLGWEICQELWDIKNVSSDLYDKFGCHLVVNSSASYWELRKLEKMNDMIRGISLRAGACYAYSNLFGCDGQRYVFSGMGCIYDRGILKEIMDVDSNLLGTETYELTYKVNPSAIDEHRAQWGIRPDLGTAAALNGGLKVWNLSSDPKAADASKIDSTYKVLQLKIDQPKTSLRATRSPRVPVKIKFQDEINIYVSLWLWDYLRRSGMKGFMMPLSGGLDSSTVAMLVFGMCNLIKKTLANDTITGASEYFRERHGKELGELIQMSSRDICKLILKCTYISTKYSGRETEARARTLCQAIGAEYSTVSIQDVYEECRRKDSATRASNDEVTLLDQNLQARLRMTMTYYLSGGNRIVLATGNVDEGIMGYLTKYDCSSADLNPIGGLCKDDLKSYLKHCCNLYSEQVAPNLKSVLSEIIEAPPSAELTGTEQRDEEEIGITYAEISVLGKVRRGVYGCCGPKGAFECVWRNRGVPPFSTHIRCLQGRTPSGCRVIVRELGELIKRFYTRYTRNRHKLTVLTPALHAETYSPDDNRFDHRQFLYPPMKDQFACIDQLVATIEKHGDLQ